MVNTVSYMDFGGNQQEVDIITETLISYEEIINKARDCVDGFRKTFKVKRIYYINPLTSKYNVDIQF